MGKFIDRTGQQFGRLTVIKRGPDVEGRLRGGKVHPEYRCIVVQWYCRCICGNEVLIQAGNLRSGTSQSCGCLRKEITAKNRTTHGHTLNRKASTEYETWYGMIKRCYNPKTKGYKNYGGRGIGVCTRWQVFENFLADMGLKPRSSQRISIDRINNDGDYEPSNCRWATDSEQQLNKRKTPRI